MKTQPFTYLLFTLILTGCINHRNNKSLEIQIDDTYITVDAVGFYLKSKSVSNGKEIIIDTLFDITPSDEQEVYHLAEIALSKKNYSFQTLSCYAGQNFSIEFIKDNDTLKLKNGSLKNWTEVNPEFEKINQILLSYSQLDD